MFNQHQMLGDLRSDNGIILARGGFMPGAIPQSGFGMQVAPQIQRQLSPELQDNLGAIQRGEFTGDVTQVLTQLATDVQELQRGITTGNTAFPVRENLEAPASLLIPTETPVRNMLPRVPGAGVATAWRQLTSLGGGWGTGTYDQPGGGSAIRMFYPETGAPVEHTSVYASKTAPYKLLGTLGSVTGFAQASGANFQDQLAAERQNQMLNLMLNEELALLYGDATSTAAPWGDGTTALAFNGLMNLVTTANGTPSAQVQTAVGPLTTSHIDAQLTRIWQQGGKGLFIIMNAQETVSLAKILQSTGSIQRLQITNAGNATLGFHVATYIHPVSGLPVQLYTSLFMKPGEMLFGALRLPDGKATAEVEVLPQLPVPTAPEKPQQIQGYVVTDLARTLTQPDVHPFMISCYEVLKLRSALHMAKSTGIQPSDYVAP